jgi:ribosomal protein S18
MKKNATRQRVINRLVDAKETLHRMIWAIERDKDFPMPEDFNDLEDLKAYITEVEKILRCAALAQDDKNNQPQTINH